MRVSAATVQGVFVVKALSGDTLVLRGSAPSVSPASLPMNAITMLHVRRARTGGEGALRGAGIGFLVGAGIGAIIGLNSGDAWFSARESAAMGGVFLGGAGAAAGLIVGISAPGERWVRVDPRHGLGFARDRNGTPLVTYSFRF